MSVGIRNRNWLNIKQVEGVAWRGSTGEDARGHAIFEAPEWSIRAGIRILRSYRRLGLNTVRAIIGRWAPATDTLGSVVGSKTFNQPGRYADFVASRAGVRTDEPLDLFEADGKTLTKRGLEKLPRILNAMAIYELGHAATKEMHFSVIERGVAIYVSETAPKA